jgi:hypothetical protein
MRAPEPESQLQNIEGPHNRDTRQTCGTGVGAGAEYDDLVPGSIEYPEKDGASHYNRGECPPWSAVGHASSAHDAPLNGGNKRVYVFAEELRQRPKWVYASGSDRPIKGEQDCHNYGQPEKSASEEDAEAVELKDEIWHASKLSSPRRWGKSGQKKWQVESGAWKPGTQARTLAISSEILDSFGGDYHYAVFGTAAVHPGCCFSFDYFQRRKCGLVQGCEHVAAGLHYAVHHYQHFVA